MNAPASLSSADYEHGLRLSADGRHSEAIARFERALALKPDDVRVLFALGNTARALGLAKPAEEFFRRVLTAEPERLEALVNLANLLRARGDAQAAIALLLPAAQRNPESAELWLTLGSAYRERGERTEAEAFYREALARRPDYSAALGNLADLVADQGEIDTALELYDRALKREPDNAQAKLNRAVLHLLKGNLKDGWRDYASRLKVPGKAPLCNHGLPRWDGHTVKRKRLLITTEQGIGDQVMFASLFGELAARAETEGGSILLECEPRLVTLFARSFANITVKPCHVQNKGGATVADYAWLKSAGGANTAIEMGSLPRLMRGDIAKFSAPHVYLAPDAQEKARWRKTFEAAGEGPSVGICWRSGKSGGGRTIQYAPLTAWADFLRELPGAIVSVQYDATVEEIAELERLSGRKIIVPNGIDQKLELDRACSLLSALDGVVSAPTAVSWLAAAAGTPTYKVLYDTSWTSFGSGYEPFAPACVCVMPESAGDWADVFGKVLAAINLPPPPLRGRC
ncbi:MAG: tetratricopeptide repeat protein [Proteobacteria bacterium]|nr:tetratricopeptide repeat protein [Pseudomonadota bacterium]